MSTDDNVTNFVYCPNSVFSPTIDSIYFSNINENGGWGYELYYFPAIKNDYWFWSSSPSVDNDHYAQIVSFFAGYKTTYGKLNGNNVRLVRGGQ